MSYSCLIVWHSCPTQQLLMDNRLFFLTTKGALKSYLHVWLRCPAQQLDDLLFLFECVLTSYLLFNLNQSYTSPVIQWVVGCFCDTLRTLYSIQGSPCLKCTADRPCSESWQNHHSLYFHYHYSPERKEYVLYRRQWQQNFCPHWWLNPSLLLCSEAIYQQLFWLIRLRYKNNKLLTYI